MMGKFEDEHVFAFIFQALCASVVKIHAKQSQFPPGGINTNRCSSKGL
jgi:hypothetical protein